MEPSSTGSSCIGRDRHFSPRHSEEIKDPEIVHIGDSLSTVNHQVWIEQLGSMIGTGPRSSLVAFRIDLHPLLGLPIEDVDCIESLFVCSTPSEEDESIVVFIIVHGAVGSMRGDISGRGDLVPLHGDSVEAPDVVHIVGVCISTEENDLVLEYGTGMAPT